MHQPEYRQVGSVPTNPPRARPSFSFSDSKFKSHRGEVAGRHHPMNLRHLPPASLVPAIDG